MLTIQGSQSVRMCDGISRRDFLRIGALGAGGLSLADVLRCQAAVRSHKAVIMVYLPGGPSHIDMYDLKPAAPAEYRGEFKPIPTNVPGMDICELMPLQARIADEFAILRGIKTMDRHNPYELLTGVPSAPNERIAVRRPVFGSVASRLLGTGTIPPYVSIGNHRNLLNEEPETAAYLGVKHLPIRVDGQELKNMTPDPEMTPDRFADRKSLLRSFDQLRRDLDNALDTMASTDQFQARALELIASPVVRDALDLNREPDRIRAKYPQQARELLRARRLVEAGVSVVTVAFHCGSGKPDPGGWDTHQYNFKILRNKLPVYDRAVYALLTDLRERGLDNDVAVVVWGEFGRKPKVGDLKPDGRSHWGPAGCALMAGGGLRMGQVVGATDARAEQAKGRPITAQNVLATLYHVLGIDPATSFPDHAGRPVAVLDAVEPIQALI